MTQGDNEQQLPAIVDKFNNEQAAVALEASFAAPKVATGYTYIFENDRIEPSEEEKNKLYGIAPDEFNSLPEELQQTVKESFIPEQIEHYKDAKARTIVTYENHLDRAKKHSLLEVHDSLIESMKAELSMIKDGWDKYIFKHIEDGMSAEAAVDVAYQDKIDMFSKMPPPHNKFTVELGQHRAAIQHHLHPDKTLATMDNVSKGAVLVSSSIALSSLSSLNDPETGDLLIKGIITDSGSMQSHAAILAQSMGIPFALVSSEELARIKNDEHVILDGPKNTIYLQPTNALLEQYKGKSKCQETHHEMLSDRFLDRDPQVETQDGKTINIYANYTLSAEARQLNNANPVGIGLYRTEIAASMRDTHQDAASWQMIFESNMNKTAPSENEFLPTTIRTVDFAGDKSNLEMEERKNTQDKITAHQMEALVRVQANLSKQGQGDKLKVMVPLIASAEAMRNMQTQMDSIADDLNLETIHLGTMVEVPALLGELDKLDVAFMSVGTNDLINSILGIENRFGEESEQQYDPTHPAVLQALDIITTVGKKQDIPTSICGNMASDPKYVALLIGAGFENLSSGIDDIPMIKEMATRVNTEEAHMLFKTIIDTDTREEREAILAHFNENRLGLDTQEKIDLNWQRPNNELDMTL